jgi:hypothetical protein
MGGSQNQPRCFTNCFNLAKFCGEFYSFKKVIKNKNKKSKNLRHGARPVGNLAALTTAREANRRMSDLDMVNLKQYQIYRVNLKVKSKGKLHIGTVKVMSQTIKKQFNLRMM